MGPGVFEQFWDAVLATDPTGREMNPPQLRAPNGVLEEFATYWAVGKPYYDPSEIAVPTLLIRAEWDAILPGYQSQNLFKKLSNVPYKRLVEIGEGSHFVLLERNRVQLFDEITLFLKDKSTGPEHQSLQGLVRCWPRSGGPGVFALAALLG